jgi:hypothetical protein
MSVVAIGGQPVRVGGQVQRATDWRDLATWRNLWDVAGTKVADGRVAEIPDPYGHMPMRPMPGAFPLLGASFETYGPVPAPLWLESSPRFNGRPALACDHFPTTGSVFGDLYAGLTPNATAVDGVENPYNYFNPPTGYSQPYWVAVLGRLGLPDDFGGDPEADSSGIFDATHGGDGTGPTIGRKIVGLGDTDWQVSNFGPGLVLITVDGHPAVTTETVLILCCVNGASSFLEINWRTSGGTLGTSRQAGTLQPWNYLECFVGWVHGPYLSLMGIGLGVPDEDELDAIRTWSSYWMPAAATLADEP